MEFIFTEVQQNNSKMVGLTKAENEQKEQEYDGVYDGERVRQTLNVQRPCIVMFHLPTKNFYMIPIQIHKGDEFIEFLP